MSRRGNKRIRQLERRVAELDVDVRSTVEAGDPSGVLVELSRDAQLLVLPTAFLCNNHIGYRLRFSHRPHQALGCLDLFCSQLFKRWLPLGQLPDIKLSPTRNKS